MAVRFIALHGSGKAAETTPETILAIKNSVRVRDNDNVLGTVDHVVSGIDRSQRKYFLTERNDPGRPHIEVSFDRVVQFEPQVVTSGNGSGGLLPPSERVGVDPVLVEAAQGTPAYLSARVRGTVASYAAKGQRKMQCDNYLEFTPGQLVCINKGAGTEEYIRIRSHGSLIFDSPLQFDHIEGEVIETIPIMTQETSSGNSNHKNHKCETLDFGNSPEPPDLERWKVKVIQMIGLSSPSNPEYAQEYSRVIAKAKTLEELDEPSRVTYPHLRLQFTKGMMTLAKKSSVSRQPRRGAD